MPQKINILIKKIHYMEAQAQSQVKAHYVDRNKYITRINKTNNKKYTYTAFISPTKRELIGEKTRDSKRNVKPGNL